MALFAGNVFSHELMMNTQLYVVLPQDERDRRGGAAPKTLVLLHGLSDNAAGWCRGSQAEVFALEHDVALVMPEAHRSFYQDMVYGHSFFSYISRELPLLCAEMFHISTRREDMLVAGLSMGGYGALLAALRCPDVFGVCGAFSGACDLGAIVKNYAAMQGWDRLGFRLREEFTGIFGAEMAIGPDRDLYALAQKCAGESRKPEIYMACGTEDPLLPQSEAMSKTLRELGFDCEYEKWPGVHDWHFWNEALRRFLARYVPR